MLIHPPGVGVVVDLVAAEDGGPLCDHCSDPIDGGEPVAVLSTTKKVHDGCRPVGQPATHQEHHK